MWYNGWTNPNAQVFHKQLGKSDSELIYMSLAGYQGVFYTNALLWYILVVYYTVLLFQGTKL